MKKITKKPVSSKLSSKQILRMVIEWDSVTLKYEGEYRDWWKKYPSYSFKDVIEEAKKKIKTPTKNEAPRPLQVQ